MRSHAIAWAVVWVAGLVAGLLLRSASAQHGVLASLVVVATTAGAAGFAAYTERRRALALYRAQERLALALADGKQGRS